MNHAGRASGQTEDEILIDVLNAERWAWRSAEVVDVYIFRVQAVAKERPRAIIIYKGGRPIAIMHTPEATRKFEEIVANITKQQASRVPGKEERLGMQVDIVNDTKRGDLSNFWKSIEDGMQRVAFHDDAQLDYGEPMRLIDKRFQPQIRVKILRKRG